ncbi:HTH-type transcriptional activator CmpR [Planctomycetales bacterium 10988]|nr:HTH-type transcriptional activator CmpR [Planctomycetales bacterium 10988]
MQMKALKIFCDVVRQRSFSKAADENEISQSAASQLVNHLEQRLGVKLLDRSKRPFVLTPEGKVFYEGGGDLVEQYLALEDKVRSMHQEVAGRVRVASIYSVGLHLMNLYLQDFLREHPKANVRLEYLHPDLVYRSVERDLAELGLVSFPKSSRSINAIPWRNEPIVFVCSPDHPLADADEIDLEEIDGMKMVSFDQGLSIRREIDRVLNQRRIDVEVAMEFDNIETIKRAIEIGTGVGLLPEPTVYREVAAGTLGAVSITSPQMVRPLGIIHRQGKPLSTTAEHFIELLQREGSELSQQESLASIKLKKNKDSNSQNQPSKDPSDSQVTAGTPNS